MSTPLNQVLIGPADIEFGTCEFEQGYGTVKSGSARRPRGAFDRDENRRCSKSSTANRMSAVCQIWTSVMKSYQ